MEDTGPGIDPERMETLFDSYHQAERPAPPPQGMGLGLALCRGIAQGHGGAITAESRQGRGSRFTFSMPDRLSGTVLSDVHFDAAGRRTGADGMRPRRDSPKRTCALLPFPV